MMVLHHKCTCIIIILKLLILFKEIRFPLFTSFLKLSNKIIHFWSNNLEDFNGRLERVINIIILIQYLIFTIIVKSVIKSIDQMKKRKDIIIKNSNSIIQEIKKTK